ncbi:MAG TPA: hypothetical protein PKB06_12295, partial [Actinotalea sp.]|nr:hypothetical protein [Actinotalea sp.]
ESAGMADDGTPEWTIRDALVARNPGDEPGYLQACEGMEAVVAYSPPTATGPTLPVTAAWGVDDGATRLVELEPDAVTCEYVGD